MKIKTLFFDIDQTLYDSEKNEIPKSAILGIKQAQEKGILAFISTGRPFCSILDLKALNVIKWDGYVCGNGAAYYDANGKLLKEIIFTTKQVKELTELCQKYQVSLALQTNNDVFAPIIYKDYIEKAFGFFNTTLPQYKEYQNEHVNMAMVFQNNDFDYEIINQIAGLKAIKGKSNYADVINVLTNKGKGIKTMHDLLKIKGDSMSFGDGDNDIELLQLADIGVAMGNGTKTIKENADFITTAFTEDGIYNALKHFEII